MPKIPLGMNVLEAAKERISWIFDNFDKIYLSFSGGKDSTVTLHLTMEEAIKRNRKIGVLIVDLEGQYKLTIEHLENCLEKYKANIDPFWVCLPIHLRNAVSVFEPFWKCWDSEKEADWIRQKPDVSIKDNKFFDFFQDGMEFEEFVPLFGEWYAQGESCACIVGIRADESLNRFRTIASTKKTRIDDKQWTTVVTDNVCNVYPIYDWRGEDIWTYHGKNPELPHNRLYDYMHKAGVPLGHMRICQPYGDDQRRGLWLFHLVEPSTWAKIVARVAGANSGALYIMNSGNINGYNKIEKPEGHTWKSFAELLISTMPPKTKEHFENKIMLFLKWWIERDYPDGIPDEADQNLEAKRDVPSWRRICKSILRNDYWCKGLGFCQHKSEAYHKYIDLMRRRKKEWGKNNAKWTDTKFSQLSFWD
jgi:predicted phosphoadenosine phosphosulfate sulfurtransferase